MNIFSIRYRNTMPDKVFLMHLISRAKVKVEWLNNYDTINVYWENNQKDWFKGIISDVKKFFPDVEITVQMNVAPEMLYETVISREKQDLLKTVDNPTIVMAYNEIDGVAKIEEKAEIKGTASGEETFKTEAVTEIDGVAKIEEKAEDKGTVGVKETFKTEAVTEIDGVAKIEETAEDKMVLKGEADQSKPEEAQSTEKSSIEDANMETKKGNAEVKTTDTNSELSKSETEKTNAKKTKKKKVALNDSNALSVANTISREAYEEDLKVLFAPYLKKYDLTKYDETAVSAFCEETNLNGGAMYYAILFASVAPTEKEMYTQIARIIGGNAAKTQVATKMTFGRWINKEYPEFVESHPGVKFNDFLNIFRKKDKF